MRKRIFEIIDVAQPNDKASKAYDLTIIFVILLSMIPLMFKESNAFFVIIDIVAAFAFFIDYILNFVTADYRLKKGSKSFFLYPFTFRAFIDFLCILPSVGVVAPGFALIRLFRVFVAFRALKIWRYSESISIIRNVLKDQRIPLYTVFSLAISYTLISALVVFNIEPDSFPTFFDAFYWAVVSLTTIGYGDFVPVTIAGKTITMLSTLVGMAIIALPSGIITAGYIKELDKKKDPDNALDEIDSYLKM